MLKTTSKRSGGRLLTYILNIMTIKGKLVSPPWGATKKSNDFFVGGNYKKAPFGACDYSVF